MSAKTKEAVDAVPSNWCDPLLTGPKAVIGKPPYDCRDIERLLNAIRIRVHNAQSAQATKPKGKR